MKAIKQISVENMTREPLGSLLSHDPDFVVMKFGGSSVGGVKELNGVAGIVKNVESKKAVVVSAKMGVTDKLVKLRDAVISGEGWECQLEAIRAEHHEYVRDLFQWLSVERSFDDEGWVDELKDDVDSVIGELGAAISDLLDRVVALDDREERMFSDVVLSAGELISHRVVAAVLRVCGVNAEAVDAREMIFTDDEFTEAKVDFENTNLAIRAKIRALLDQDIVPVITGFVARSGHETTTLGRGGSDYTGAIVAAAMSEVFENVQYWICKTVPGVMEADPRLASEAQVHELLSYYGLEVLANLGMRAVHPAAVAPVRENNIPLRFVDTDHPEEAGTLVFEPERELVGAKTLTMKEFAGPEGERILEISLVGPGVGLDGVLYDEFCMALGDCEVVSIERSYENYALTARIRLREFDDKRLIHQGVFDACFQKLNESLVLN